MPELVWFGWKLVLESSAAYLVTWVGLAFFGRRLRIGGIEGTWIRTLQWIIMTGLLITIIGALQAAAVEVLRRK